MPQGIATVVFVVGILGLFLLDRDRKSALKKPLLRMRLPYLYSSLTAPPQGTMERPREG